MNDDKAKAAWHNPPRKLDAETLALLLSRHRYGAEVDWYAEETLDAARYVLTSPEMQADRAAVWQEGCHWGANSLGGPPSPDNPYQERP